MLVVILTLCYHDERFSQYPGKKWLENWKIVNDEKERLSKDIGMIEMLSWWNQSRPNLEVNMRWGKIKDAEEDLEKKISYFFFFSPNIS